MKVNYPILVLLLGFISSSCKTTGYVANVDKNSRKIEIHSQSDSGSAVYGLQRKGILNEAKAELKTALKENKRDIKSLINLSQIYLAQGSYKKAEKTCRQALKYDLKNKDARLILAQIYYRRGYTDMTDIILNSLGDEANKNSIALNLKALVALKNDRPAHAMNFFKTALKYNANDIATRMNLGVLYIYYRQVDEASTQFERILNAMPEHVDAKLHLAIIKSSRGNFDSAEDLYKDVLDIDPENALATYNLAVLEEKRKNYDDSLDFVKSYLNTNYAKKQDNKEVFAMIERLRAKKDMLGESVSDDEIQALSGQLKNPPKPEPVLDVEDNEPREAAKSEVKPLKSTKNDTPKKKVLKKKPKVEELKYDDDDIESLERALIE